jgi:hypothetical protein
LFSTFDFLQKVIFNFLAFCDLQPINPASQVAYSKKVSWNKTGKSGNSYAETENLSLEAKH